VFVVDVTLTLQIVVMADWSRRIVADHPRGRIVGMTESRLIQKVTANPQRRRFAWSGEGRWWNIAFPTGTGL
jgi:hypothetical protein